MVNFRDISIATQKQIFHFSSLRDFINWELKQDSLHQELEKVRQIGLSIDKERQIELKYGLPFNSMDGLVLAFGNTERLEKVMNTLNFKESIIDYDLDVTLFIRKETDFRTITFHNGKDSVVFIIREGPNGSTICLG